MNTPPTPNTVRELINCVSLTARHLKISKSAVYRWINVNRVPADQLLKLAAYYRYQPTELAHLTGSEKTNNTRVILKPRTVLATLLEVYRDQKTLEQALEETGHTKISLTLIQKRWGDRLPTLYTTLEQLDQGRIDLDDACGRLNVTKCTMHGIRRKYGYCPGPVKAKDKPKKKPDKTQACIAAALDCVKGQITVKQAAMQVEVCERTITRTLARLSPVNMRDINNLPAHVRDAYAADIAEKDPENAVFKHLEALPEADTAWLMSKIRGK